VRGATVAEATARLVAAAIDGYSGERATDFVRGLSAKYSTAIPGGSDS
jgi:hypothetical protein